MSTKSVYILKTVLCLILIVAFAISLCSCGKRWVCGQCGKEFNGKAYYDYSGEGTLCEDCARSYWSPLPYKNYRK